MTRFRLHEREVCDANQAEWLQYQIGDVTAFASAVAMAVAVSQVQYSTVQLFWG